MNDELYCQMSNIFHSFRSIRARFVPRDQEHFYSPGKQKLETVFPLFWNSNRTFWEKQLYHSIARRIPYKIVYFNCILLLASERLIKWNEDTFIVAFPTGWIFRCLLYQCLRWIIAWTVIFWQSKWIFW
jgi:hypothetical protein